MPLITVLWRWHQEVKFKVVLYYIEFRARLAYMGPCLKKKKSLDDTNIFSTLIAAGQ